jgi:hypothetical protein
MLRLLATINGRLSIAEIQEELTVSYENLFTDLQLLHSLRLIKMAAPRATEPRETMSKMKTLHYRGRTLDLEKRSVPQDDLGDQKKAVYYRGVAYKVAVGS